MADKSKMKELEEKLRFTPESGWRNDIDTDAVEGFAEKYKEFLGTAKTEREAASFIIEKAEEHGFKPLDEKDSLKPGDKVYAVNRNKQVAMAKIGGSMLDRVKMTVSHLDSPRLDFKQKPLYEDADLALADTHYYGGIKAYQWMNIPLSIHGVVIDKDGESQEIVVGEEDDDPVFVVPDLLPHLGKEQMKKKMKDAIEAEDLNIVLGNMPVDDDEVKEAVKLQLLQHLNEEYGIMEEDLVSAEFEAVPAMAPRDVGFDRSLVAAYGQDDKGLSFITLQALLDAEPENTAVAWFFDKEEIGSEGNTSVQSEFLERFMASLLELTDNEDYHAGMYDVFDSVDALSADVTAGVNPTYKDVHDQKNAINLGQGVGLVKFTGSGGKYSANDAHAEFVGEIRKILNDNDIPYHPVELGKVGKGGGGTVAKFLARRGADVVDLGMALISMHSPFELSSKIDLYYTHQACTAFFQS